MSYRLSDIDQQIIDLFFSASGQEKAFRLLVDTYRERLYWHIRRLVVKHDDADDVLQNVNRHAPIKWDCGCKYQVDISKRAVVEV